MTETENKQKRQAEWLRQHELTDDQLERLIENKLIRASQWHEAIRKREILLEDR